MVLDFDLASFMEDMKACKPPYRCPFPECGRVYKTYAGISGHLATCPFRPRADGSATPARSPSPQPFFGSPVKESLIFDELEKKIEFEADGRIHRLSIYENLQIVDKRDWEATLPPKLAADDKKGEDEDDGNQKNGPGAAQVATGMAAAPKTPKTPSANRFHKKKKTPKTSKPPAEAEREAQEGREGVEKKMLKLPEAHFSEIDDYDIEDAPPMPSSYYRFIEKSGEEQDEEVEYDMDEEDVAWLDIINDKRSNEGLQLIGEGQFELLMDRLEKESYFHVQANGKESFTAPIDEDAICCVCMDGECSNTNVILFCDLCNLAVHQECYGVPYIPEGQWLCRRCLQSPSRSVECVLCPNKGGAFKQTDDGRWAHVVCALWIPEVRFANTVFLEPIDSIDNIPPARWKLSCRVCKQRLVGASIQCHKTNCYTAFHVTCGLLAGFHMKMDTVRESSANGLSVTVRKTAYCDVHTPADSDCKPNLENLAALGIATPSQKKGGNGNGSNIHKTPKKEANGKASATSPVAPVLFRGLMNFSPQCPWEKVQEIASLINVQRKNQFFQRLMAYWTLKRQTRNGVPLIRRLQFAKAMRADKTPETPQKNAHHAQKKKKKKTSSSTSPGQRAAARKAKDEFKAMAEQRRSFRRLRQDLEKVRLLCELIRKREQRKRELVAAQAEAKALECWPFVVFLRKVMEALKEIDQQEIFAEPVNPDDVPDYLELIKKPMDFRTMSEKLDSFAYESLDQLEADFAVMVDNCLQYNERDTIFYRAGVKMRDQGGSIIRRARRTMEAVGFDGFQHSAQRGPPVAQAKKVSDDEIMKEIDDFLGGDAAEEMSDEGYLKMLLELQDKAQLMHHPVAKMKRQRSLKQEITKVRRKLTLDKSGNATTFKTKRDGTEGEVSKKKKKKSKAREVSPVTVGEDAGEKSRRLRAGRDGDEKKTTTPASAGRKGKKRGRPPSDHSKGAQPPPPKKPAYMEDTPTKTPQKAGGGGGAGATPVKSPAGVNRRNAVLFTKKKQAAVAPTGDTPSKEDGNSKPTTSGAGGAAEVLDEQETVVPSPASPAAPVAQKEEKSKKSGLTKEKKKRGRKPKARGAGPAVEEEKKKKDEAKKDAAEMPKMMMDDLWREAAPKSASFQEYRRGGGDLGETDEDTQSESATDALISDDDEEGDDLVKGIFTWLGERVATNRIKKNYSNWTDGFLFVVF